MSDYRELVLGCGHSLEKRIRAPGTSSGWRCMMTLDRNPETQPSVICDLDVYPWGHNLACEDDLRDRAYLQSVGSQWWAFRDDYFEEVHAYEVLEHLGSLGDTTSFFRCFTEIWRILKPGGYLCGTCPSSHSQWSFGDPGHTRVIWPSTLTFLVQPQYEAQVGVTAMSDYRYQYRADFDVVITEEDSHTHRFVLRAVKPSRVRV